MNILTLTDKAAKHLLKLIQEDPENRKCLRISVTPGGCAGLYYNLDFVSEPAKDDGELNEKGIKVVMDADSLLYMLGTEIDYDDGLNAKGFVYKNPNAKKCCHCGDSFGT